MLYDKASKIVIKAKKNMKLIYEEVLERFLIAMNAESKADLARKLGIAPPSITKWQKTGAVPLNNIISSLPKEKAVWVIYGGDPVKPTHNQNANDTQSVVPLQKYEELQKEYYKLQGALENCKEVTAHLASELSKPTGTFVTPRERATQ